MRFGKLQIIAVLSALIILPMGYAQAEFCPEGAYVGRDNQGNTACRDILSNQIIDSETIVTDSGRGTISDSGRTTITNSIITNSDDTIISNDNQTDYTIFGILGFFGAIGAAFSVYGKKILSSISGKKILSSISGKKILSSISGKKIVPGIPQFTSWNSIQKEEVRKRQYQMCNICYTKPSKWAYDHIDGDNKNNDINNCQGLCVQCKSEKMMIKI